ncbi:MAG TPA: PDZ domain-containing protein [Thermoanaerobaculia bacterium]|nr:PDZ domain-containing protein [Thermoanaerobaculia bacterium]
MRKVISLAAVLFTAAALAGAQPKADDAGGTRLLRYPDVHGDMVVFCYAGDLWLAKVDEASTPSGAVARRLTSHPGEELFPKFSPDGRQVAFTAEYSGNRQIHVIQVDGGNSRQLTFYNEVGEIPLRAGYDNQVLDWTPDGKDVLFWAHRVPYTERLGRPYLVPAAGGMEKPLPIPEGSGATFSPDGTRVAYTPIMREFRTWKRYRGGRAPDIWVYDLAHDTAERVTDSPATDDLPVWIGDTLYFTSDREAGRLELYALDLKSKSQPRRVTTSKDWDVLWPSGDGRRIVYQSGGWIWLLDPASGQTRRLTIRIEGDLPQALPYFTNVTKDIQWMRPSPTGKRAVFEAHGDIVTVPAEHGEIRNLTATSGIREMTPGWSPDGRWIAYLSDRTGEYEVWVRPSDGSGEERQVTRGGDSWRNFLLWSPDSKKIAFSDKELRLRYVEVDSGRIVDVDQGHRFDIIDYQWSPDSRWLTYTKTGASQLASIWVWSLDQKKGWQLTSDSTKEAEPVFDPTGKYLFFLSDRDFNITLSGFEQAYVYTEPTRVYVGILAKDGPALLRPQSDDEPAGEAKKQAKDEPARGKPEPVRIDPEGFEQRVRALPVDPGVYNTLLAGPGAVYYIVTHDGTPQLRRFDLDEEKEEVILSGLQVYDLSADGKKILYKQGNTYGIIDPRPGQNPGSGKLPMEKLELRIDPRAEWAQMFADAWRGMRDWFYDPAVNGVDWKRMRDRYGELLPYVASRQDLDFVLGELGGEVSAGHVYVEKGNEPGVERVENGLLGAEVEAHPSGYFKISHIFPGENWHEEFRSPLTEPGVDVETGDFILAVDGQTTRGVDNFYQLLQNKAKRVVTLRVNGRPSEDGAREVRVRPVASEQGPRYLEWVQTNRAKVEKASGGRIGYIHLPDTAIAGNRELFKAFYAQSYKDALILDDRYNNGGFVPDTMIGLLSRPLLNYWVARGTDFYSTPGFVNAGPKVMLINGLAGSGGDALPFYFRKLNLGPLIGTRTWGGLIGLNNSPTLLDGGQLSTPSFRFLTTEGTWAVENEGVAPDIEVIDRPDAIAKGKDPSLEAAIDYLLKELAKNPPKKVTVPSPPKGGEVR